MTKPGALAGRERRTFLGRCTKRQVRDLFRQVPKMVRRSRWSGRAKYFRTGKSCLGVQAGASTQYGTGGKPGIVIVAFGPNVCTAVPYTDVVPVLVAKK